MKLKRPGWTAAIVLTLSACLDGPDEALEVVLIGTTDAGTTAAGSTGPDPDASSSSGEVPPPNPCAGLDESACDGTPSCIRVYGSPVVGQGPTACAGDFRYAGCRGEDWCRFLGTYGCPPDESAVYWFDNSCIPSGWHGCRPSSIPTKRCEVPTPSGEHGR